MIVASKIKQVKVPLRPKNMRVVFHLYIIFVENISAVQVLFEKGIEAKIHYPKPMYLQESVKYLGHKKNDFPTTDEYCKKIISFPCDQHYLKTKIYY